MNSDSSCHTASHKGTAIALMIALAVVSGVAGGGNAIIAHYEPM